jgi:hypothetical protein
MAEEVGCQVCGKLSPGERVCCGSEFSWKESRSCYKSLRISVRHVVEAQGMGSEAVDGLSYVTVKVYNPGVGQACGE